MNPAQKLPLIMILAAGLSLSASGCVKRSRGTSQYVNHDDRSSSAASVPQEKADNSQTSSSVQATPKRININTASAQELETLPGIGKALAERIIEHRSKYGPFRKPEHLIIMRGISDKRFQNLRDLITVE